jgi:hypothetical protein
MKFSIRLLYLYLFSFVGLLVVVIGSIQLVDLTLKTVFFKNVDIYEYSRPIVSDCPEGKCPAQETEEEFNHRVWEEAKRNRQRQFSSAVSMIVVGLPLYWYHWKTLNQEKTT